MPPNVKITKEEIINAAVAVVRSSGARAINARTIASALHCSTQPVFSNFATMDELRLAVVEKAEIFFESYIQKEIEKGKYPAYKASGMAYIRFAKEEKELFKLLYMRDRTKEITPISSKVSDAMETIVQKNTGLGKADVQMFHMEMWAYVHGIATMIATDFIKLDFELVSRMLTDAYQGMCKHYGMER